MCPTALLRDKKDRIFMRRTELFHKIEQYAQQEHLLAAGDRVVAGVSGGPDSLCLLLMLVKLGANVTVVHVNHGIREEAGEDEAYVCDFCGARQIPCRVIHADVPGEARMRQISEEEAGRMIRYEALEKVREEIGADHIALAHHQGDQAETVLLNLFRGTGVTGLSGMPPQREHVIRPLLTTTRKEIEAFLQEEGITWQTDRTNLENHYTRNRIRNLVMPMINEAVNEQAEMHIAQTATDLQLLGDYLKRELQKAWERCTAADTVSEHADFLCVILKAAWEKEDPYIRRSLLLQALTCCAGKKRDLGRKHVEILEELMDLQVGRHVDLPYACYAERIYEGIRLGKKQGSSEKETDNGRQAESESAGSKTAGPGAEESVSVGTLHCEILEVSGDEDLASYTVEKEYTKYFDYDIINYCPELRTRRGGDYIIVDGNGSRQKLSRYFINEKIPSEQRDTIPVAAIGDEILWIIGYRMSEHGKVTEATRRILEITLEPR